MNLRLSPIAMEESIVNTVFPFLSSTMSASARSGNSIGTLTSSWSIPAGMMMLICGVLVLGLFRLRLVLSYLVCCMIEYSLRCG